MYTFTKDVRELVERGQKGYCAKCTMEINDFHHRVPNTKSNRKLLPHFLQSPFNCVGLCRDCHTNFVHEFYLDLELAMAYEQYLKEMS